MARDAMVRQDASAPLHEALREAALSAFPPGEYVGQESFVPASEIRELAWRSDIGPGVSVLDLCCGVAGPGRLITAELGCAYLGVDEAAGSVEVARALAADLPCRFEQRHLPPLPPGRYDVILLLEALLAFPDKRALLKDVAGALEANGRFAFTAEEGRPLTAAERRQMPGGDTVWPVQLADLEVLLSEAGLAVAWQRECTVSHLQTARALLRSYCAHAGDILRELDSRQLADLITAHELWCSWMESGRIRKFAVVARAAAE